MTYNARTWLGACLASLMLASAAHAATPVAGGINSNGTPQTTSSRYTVAHPTTGEYVITFTPGFSPYPTCLYTIISPASRVSGAHESGNTCEVSFVSLSTGAATDTLFTFIAITTSH